MGMGSLPMGSMPIASLPMAGTLGGMGTGQQTSALGMNPASMMNPAAMQAFYQVCVFVVLMLPGGDGGGGAAGARMRACRCVSVHPCMQARCKLKN